MPIFHEGYSNIDLPLLESSVCLHSKPSTCEREKKRQKFSEESTSLEAGSYPIRKTTELDKDENNALINLNRVELVPELHYRDCSTWVPKYGLEPLQLCDQISFDFKTSNPKFLNSILGIVPFPSQDATMNQDKLLVGHEDERSRSDINDGNHIQGAHQEDSGDESIAPLNKRQIRPVSWCSNKYYQRTPNFHQKVFALSGDQKSSSCDRPSNELSLFSSNPCYVRKFPTSPLVHSESNGDLENTSIDYSGKSTTDSRYLSGKFRQRCYSDRDSLIKNDNPLSSKPRSSNSPKLHCQRFNFKKSSLFNGVKIHHSSMVISYEESIIRGRMSTIPSKPLDFIAQIGVLGFGKCKPSLQCPAHVTVNFSAVFYCYETSIHGNITKCENGPSPYVGLIDLENKLSTPKFETTHRNQQLNYHQASISNKAVELSDVQVESGHEDSLVSASEDNRYRSIKHRAPPGGSYRIPKVGQIQIIVKNPNKIAVKLFLVPYDLSGMKPGTKTFIRQRSYSTEQSGAISAPPKGQFMPRNKSERSTLRYLIHLQMCSPSRNRYYLYKSIRIVFANRVPDGQENLRNEVSMPEPRFSTYKPDVNISDLP
ncbi:unnamed protein product [Blumeria hordei]|uniref:Atos-like conserved domain-containing protein n=1 Tax=Blumeria hordei TaxID=2867405 RepID=A0A383UQE2_BLUHO|nr:unnamed protein product [Blumeria hordei]